MEYPDARDIYIKLNQYCRDNGAWIGRARDIYEWHVSRKENSFTCDYDPLSKTCSVVLKPEHREHFLTIHLPPHSDCTIRSGNADIIERDEDHVYIKTRHQQTNRKILIGIA
jgi:hypothetical protein